MSDYNIIKSTFIYSTLKFQIIAIIIINIRIFMKLTDLKKGDLANIISINANKILKNRFSSFGINKGAKLSLEEYSFSKKTLEIKINKSRIALRVNEAHTIEVKAC